MQSVFFSHIPQKPVAKQVVPVSQWSLFSQGRLVLKEVRSGDEDDMSWDEEDMSEWKEGMSGNEKGKSGEEEGV